MADAHENILQAERVSRSAESAERAVALAHAARCLVLLERNLSQAEAFLLEVEALAQRGGEVTSEVHFASAMLHEHRGELDTAAKAFRDARWRAREQGDRLAEFRAIEHWTMLEIDRGRVEEASRLASELATLGERVREGAEGPSARALVGLARRLAGARDQGREIEAALQELRRMDAKYPVAFVRTRLARIECAAGDWTAATAHARDGLEHAEAIGRRSEIALARVVLLRCAEVAGDSETAATHRDALTGLSRAPLSALALRALDEVSG